MVKPCERISVAMCTYNGLRFLEEQLESIAAQTLLPFEVIICDDGSTDATVEILTRFAETAPFNVDLIQNESRLGSTKNFEQAIRRCQGELIVLSDQDDSWHPEKLELLAKTLCDSDAGGVFSDGLLMNEDSSVIGGSLWSSIGFSGTGIFGRETGVAILLRGNVVTGATMMFRSNMRGVLLPIPDGWVHDGWLAWMLVLHSRLLALEKPLIRYRVHVSQQLGLRGHSLKHRAQRSRQDLMQDFRSIERQFEVLLDYVQLHPEICDPDLCLRIDEKRKHLAFRIELHQNRWARLKAIAIRISDYRLYSNGWKSMLRDALS